MYGGGLYTPELEGWALSVCPGLYWVAEYCPIVDIFLS